MNRVIRTTLKSNETSVMINLQLQYFVMDLLHPQAYLNIKKVNFINKSSIIKLW